MSGHRLITLVVACFLVWAQAGRVPEIPSGRRTQYLYLLDNGGYKYGYDTGLGSSEKALSSEKNEVTGAYSYESPNGPVSIEYTSGIGGYQPSKIAIPKDLNAMYKKISPTQQYGSLSGGNIATGSHFSSGYGISDSIIINAAPKPVAPIVSADSSAYAAATPGPDGSYSFSFETKDHARQESADSHGNVAGWFSFIPKDDGRLRTVNYVAGAEKGFIATGSDIPATPVPPIPSAVTSSSSVQGVYNYQSTEEPSNDYDSNEDNADKSYSFSYTAADHSRQESSDSQGNVIGSFSFVPKSDGISRTVNYQAGSETGFVAQGAHLPQAGQSPIPLVAGSPVSSYGYVPGIDQTGANPGEGSSDGSYSFSYNAGDHSRQETADSNGNLFGSFSFTSKDDNVLRKVDYEAGSEKGFIAKGSHLPKQPSEVPVSLSHSINSVSPLPSYDPSFSQYTPSVPYSQSIGPNQVADGGEAAPDGSYSFSYNAGDHSRQETSDSHGNVYGSFSFIPKDDTVLRKVDYEAGAEKGFIAKGAHLPKQQAEGPISVTHSSSSVSQLPSYRPSVSHHPSTVTYTKSVGQVTQGGEATPDGSYSFSYNAGDHSRQETSDAHGNVYGSFSFIPKDDSVLRKVDYEAGEEKGFIAKGTHLPKQPAEVPVSIIHSSSSVSSLPSYSPSVTHHIPAVTYTQSIGQTQVTGGEEAAPDGSYSFSYDAGDHSRQETADSHGNVVGTFSFIPKGETVSLKVDYEAGAAEGFIAKGNHLPKQPSEVPVSISQNTDYSSHDTQSEDSSQGNKAYSFSYNAGDHTRHEVSDEQGNVKGSFSFVAKDDGSQKSVTYEAGAEKGFIAKGSHLPKAPIVPPAPAVFTNIQTYDSYNPAQGSPSGINYVNTDEGDNKDASYSFSYNAGDHTRQETSDSAGNVVGSFTFVAKDDGVNRQVDYQAGAEKGFTAQGVHLPKQEAPAGTLPLQTHSNQGFHSVHQGTSHLSSSISSHSHGTQLGHSLLPPAPAVFTNIQSFGAYTPGQDSPSGANYVNPDDVDNKDASYSFSYNAGDHTRQETSDSAGNVVGKFSFVAKDDGVNRQVDYQAGAERGFTAQGAHLPKQETPAGTLTPQTQTTQGFHSVHQGTSHLTSSISSHTHSPPLGHAPVPSSNWIQEYSLGNIKVKTFLTPNSHRKVGYVFDS